MKEIFIVNGCRTAIGSFCGGLGKKSAVELGKVVIAETAKRSGVSLADADEVIFGNVLQAGLGQNVARQAAVHAGMPVDKTAMADGKFREEIVPVFVEQKKGDPIRFDTDEFPRKGVTPASLAKLRPAFKKDGTVTAGNASGINDAAACVLVASGEAVKKHGLKPMQLFSRMLISVLNSFGNSVMSTLYIAKDSMQDVIATPSAQPVLRPT